eukprot:CAMPEP_0197876392 /NCGR_PEP_ID=MMETSP1439-20131203/5373_1 /TAXON_ID=66791 /ORGANISM="Gonyaulax spinifera, Strain CCMP409" /LENGTH=72 /DNA_ID=CAMNT_0043495671 /DNA_START=46 /DNA_END=261 /DNA_ORIENTATION=-
MHGPGQMKPNLLNNSRPSRAAPPHQKYKGGTDFFCHRSSCSPKAIQQRSGERIVSSAGRKASRERTAHAGTG